jgi:hypothetical protein
LGLLIEAATRQYRRGMNPAVLIRATLLMLAISQFALADDVKTINGKEYKNVTVSRAKPDGIVVKTKSGIIIKQKLRVGCSSIKLK